MAPMDFYYWSTPNGWKIAIALYEMDLPFNLNLVDLSKGEQFLPEFEGVSPNHRMPAIVDPDGPDGAPISVFESGAILQYLARKTGRFYGSDERDQTTVDEWLMWQMSALGPIAGQTHHFLFYAPNFDPPMIVPYAQQRFKREIDRLYVVLDKQLSRNTFVVGEFYSIADMAIWPWISRHERQQIDLEDLPNIKRWFDMMWARPNVQAGRNLSAENELRLDNLSETQSILFGVEPGKG